MGAERGAIEWADEVDGKRVGAGRASRGEVRRRNGTRRHLVVRLGERRGDGTGELDEPRRIVPYENRSRGASPSLVALHRAIARDAQLGKPGRIDPVREALRDARETPSSRLIARPEDETAPRRGS
jgi:hypothetical protein